MKPHQTLADGMPSVTAWEGSSQWRQLPWGFRPGMDLVFRSRTDSDVSSIHRVRPGSCYSVFRTLGGHQHHPNLVKLKGGNQWFWALGSHNSVTYLYFIVTFRGFLSSKSPQTISSSNRWFQDALVCLNMAYTTTVYRYTPIFWLLDNFGTYFVNHQIWGYSISRQTLNR